MKLRLYSSLALSLAVLPCWAAPAAAAADLSSEESALARYHTELSGFDKDALLLSKKATLVVADVDGLQRRSDALKSGASGAQSSIGNVVRKLKAAGEFDNLDELLGKKITDSRFRALVLSTSFEGLLNDSTSSLGSLAGELSVPVDNLRRKLPGSTSSTPVLYRKSLGCRIGTVRLGLIGRLGGTPTDATYDTVSCACNPDKLIGLGTGTPCDQLQAN